VLHRQTIDLGKNEYYGLDVRFPRSWKRPGPWGAAIAQFDYPNLAGPPVGLFAQANQVDVDIQSGLTTWPGCTLPDHGCATSAQYSKVGTAAPHPLALGKWHAFVVHVRWATGPTGVVDVWHRLEGQRAWRHTFHIAGVPTMQWSPCCLTTAGTNPDGSERFDADKVGLYRSPNGQPISLDNGGLIIGTTFAAVAGAVDPGPTS
jgi:hypothetical protein